MKALLTVHFLKLRFYPLFWLVLALYAAFVPLIFRIFFSAELTVNEQQLDLGSFFALDGSGLWHYLMFAGSYGVHLFVLLMVSFTNRDYRYGLRRQYLLEGQNRAGLMLSDIALAALFSLSAVLLLSGATFALAWNRGILISAADMGAVFPFLLTYILYFFVFVMMALLVNSFLKNTAGSFLVVLFWSLFIEAVVRWIDPSGLSDFLPVNSLNGLIPSPLRVIAGGAESVSLDAAKVMLSLIWGAVFAAAYWWRTNREDF